PPEVAAGLPAPGPGPLRVRDRQEVAAPDRSRVVDEDVDPAEATMDRAGDPLHFVELAEVAGDDEGLGASLARDLPGRRLQGRLIARAQCDAGALGGEPAGDGAADAPARSGPQRDFFLELEVHGQAPVGAVTPCGRAGTVARPTPRDRSARRASGAARARRARGRARASGRAVDSSPPPLAPGRRGGSRS